MQTAHQHRRGSLPRRGTFSMPSTDPADNGHGDPFPDRPTQYVRALLYEYRFADPGTYVRTGQCLLARAGTKVLVVDRALALAERTATMIATNGAPQSP